MSLNSRKIKSSSNFVEQPITPVDNYPARVVSIIDLGLQDGGEWKGKKKPPKNVIRVTYECSDMFMVDEDGKELEDKPIWLSEDLNLFNPDMENAKCNERYKAIDPECVFDYDWDKLIGQPCTVLTVHKESKGKTYCNVGSVSPYIISKRNKELPELQNKPLVFLLDEPDMEVYARIPEWLQKKITGNLEFRGSKLDVLLKGGAVESTPDEPEDDDEDDWDV